MPLPVYAIAPNDVVEVTVFGRFKSQEIRSVLHYVYRSAQPGDPDQEFSILYNALIQGEPGFLSAVRAAQSIEVEYYKTRMQVISPIRRPYVDKTTLTTGSRELMNLLPPNVAAAFNKQTDKLQRGRTGSLHLCGAAVTDQNNGIWTGAYQTLLAPVATQMNTSVIGAGVNSVWDPCTWSRSKPADPGNVIGCSVMPTVRTMSKRTVGRGI